jgi:hypothetical protein
MPKHFDFEPIETWYSGHLCRSRLEARWLKFLDGMSIKFFYEYEGFQFEGGTRYLPDLWFPSVDTWAEIKPVQFNSDEDSKVKMLAQLVGRPVLKLIGLPDFCLYETVLWQPDVGAFLDGLYSSLDVAWHRRAFEKDHRLWTEQSPLPELGEQDHSEAYVKSVYIAKSARFELF